MKNKSIFSMLGGLFLSGCGLASWAFYGVIAGDFEYIDFPLGQNKQVEIPINNKVPAPYAIAIRTEFPNARSINQNRSDWYQKSAKYPFNITVHGYQVKNGKEHKFLEKTLTRENSVGFSFGSNTERPEDYAFAKQIFNFEAKKLPMGKYRFVIQDNSVPIPEYQQMKTSISIHIYQHK